MSRRGPNLFQEVILTINEFETMLRGHDWCYNYSDDHRYYTRGRQQRDAIERAIKELTEQGLREQAVELFNELSPDDFHMKS